MKTERDLINSGRTLSYSLRHDEYFIGKYGYAPVNKVLIKLDISKEELDWIVDNNDKKRFAYNEDETLIRASQGHSVKVDVELEEVNPPHILYHGTSIKNLDSIKKNGILKMNRLHVHLSADETTAIKVGMRHCKYPEKPLVLTVNAKLMHFDGYKIYKSENDVYLTDDIPTTYLNLQ